MKERKTDQKKGNNKHEKRLNAGETEKVRKVKENKSGTEMK